MGIEAAIEDLIDQVSSPSLRVTFDHARRIGRLPKALEATVYRVVQEALNNAKKYSGSDRIAVELRKANGELFLEIRDRGCGFDVESAQGATAELSASGGLGQ